MSKNKAVNFSKQEISKQINNKIGFSQNYIEDLTDDLISILKTSMIIKWFKNKGKNLAKRKRLKEYITNDIFKAKYALINLCISYSSKGMKQSRFLYRVKKQVRILQRRQDQLNKLKGDKY